MGDKPLMHVLMHIPKTGGASVASGLEKTFGYNVALRRDWFDQLIFFSKTKGLHQYKIITCHISSRELAYLADDFELSVSTILRSPIDRVFSNYCFWRRNTPDTIIKIGNREVPLINKNLSWHDDLYRLLTLSRDVWKFRELSNVMTWQLSTSIYERNGRTASQALAQAKSTLKKMRFVGFQKTLENDYKKLVSLIDADASPSELPTINMTKTRTDLVLDDAGRSLIAEFNLLDQELYEWACDFRKTTSLM
jgi:hypothetical protein